MKIEIRIVLAKKKDAKEILKLYMGEKYLKGMKGVEYDLENIKDYLGRKTNKFYIALDGKKIVGCMLVEYYIDYVYLHTTVVRKDYRNQGIGRAMFDMAENDVKRKKIKIIEAMTEIENTRIKRILAQRNYKKGNKFVYYTKIL
ncbi:MAG: GNAT family N-acetyltransferase [archaeon]|nr:GNAT family N-acetyltransferase [archaeon]MCR4323473.1 GNAT family N-acetyltransferase [Nanoarchaeota archaeon]